MHEWRLAGAGTFKENSNIIFCLGLSVLFNEAFDVWYDNSSSSLNFPVDGFGFLLGFALLEELLGSGCLVGLYEGDLFLLQGIQV